MKDPNPYELYLPTGYYTSTISFTGAAVPTGAAVTFQGDLTTTPAATLSTIATAINTHWQASMHLDLSASVTLTEIYVRYGSDDDDPGESIVLEESEPGQNTDPPCSPGVTYLMIKTSSLGGKRGRGRWYLPGCVETDIGPGGAVTSSRQNSLTTHGNAFLTALAGDIGNMCIAHRYRKEFVGTKKVPTPVGILGCEPMAATQRRRQRR